MAEGATSGVRPGDVLAGKYRVERVLGEGGMGVVVAAHHIQLDQLVAIKFLLPDALSNPAAVARFAREARTAVKIRSEHVARVTDVGELANGAPYMVMEYLEGSDLAAWLQRTGPMPIDQAVDFILQACVAIAEAHALHIVHRDLKPANLFCIRRTDGQLTIKVLDFGISKLNDPAAAQGIAAMTKTTAVMGTPLYMSPEQMRSAKVVDGRTDIWALGVILYELLTGSVPFLADSVMELALNIAQEQPAPLRSVRPDAPPALEAAIFRCIEKDKQRRFANVGELAIALLPFAPAHARPLVDRISGIVRSAGLPPSPRGSMADIPSAPSSSPAVQTPGTMSPVQHTYATAARPATKAIAAGTAVAATVALALVGWLLVRPRATPPREQALLPALATTSAPALPSESVAVTGSASAAAVTTPPIPSATAPPIPTVTATTPTTGPVTATPMPNESVHLQPHRHLINCDPPYTINAVGHRVHKPECP